MKTRYILLLILLSLSYCSAAFADRQLERTEILQILQKLTDQPRKTWIPAGTIEATHEEYKAQKTMNANVINGQINKKIRRYQNNKNKRELTQKLQKMKLDAIPFNTRYELSNEYTMSSTVTVRFDGDRFYWEINVDSRTDSVKPSKDLKDNFMTEQFNLDWNARRVFAWDGEKYTAYYLPGNHAIVDTTGSKPYFVNGPLTAGIIPWGYGYYTYESLSAADSLGVVKYIDGQTQVHLTFINPNGSETLFVMDPAKDYAVLSCSTTGYSDVVIKHYSNYQLIAGNWVPSVILLERYEAESDRLLTSDLWDITNIDTNVPESYDFDVSYEADTLIEYFSFVTDKPVMYQHSDIIDTDQLLADRLAFAANEGLLTINCATAALKYAIDLLGKDVTDQQLAQLVNEPGKTTSLYAMKKFVQNLGFYCRVVKTDIQSLKSLYGCEVILHIPGKEHFVFLEAIDGEYVWTIDLASNKFYYRTDIDFFEMDWTEGTALIISNRPIKGKFAEIAERDLGNITGASGYQCNVLRQEHYITYCEKVGEECLGYYRWFYERWGCGTAASGSCSQSWMVRCEKAACIEHPVKPENCATAEEWTAYYMRACD